MKSTFNLLLVLIVLMSCGERKPPIDEKIIEPEIKVSYESLKNLLENKGPITNEYLTDSIPVYGKTLSDHTILKEFEKYVLVKAGGGETDVSNYYVVSFSKRSGKLIDYIELGQLAEGVEPYKIRWQSSTSFSTVDYQYELVEDEESGAYMQGALLDSVVLTYRVNANGYFISDE